jgi:hypothetical protein
MDTEKLKAPIGKCSVADCEGGHYVKGLCSKHYQRMMKHGDPLSKKNLRQDPVDRFWPKVEKTETCWEWKGFRSNYGYPRFYPGDGKRMGTVLAHRWIFAHVNGPIPNDMHVDHICRNRACVRPDHLRLLTPAENGLYAQQSCRWTAKSIADMRTLAAERVKSISVEKSALVDLLDERDELIAEVERLRADLASAKSTTKVAETRMDTGFHGGAELAAPAAGTVEKDAERLADGYESGFFASDPRDGYAQFTLHYKTATQAEAAYMLVTSIIDAAIEARNFRSQSCGT